MVKIYVLVILFAISPPPTEAHGRLIEPPSRASAWRYGFDTPHNYNDHELFCGGFTRQWVKNGGKCGVCGDPWDSKVPRAHEYGGTYGQGVIVRNYSVGNVITIRVELTASHMGYFEFGVCPNYKNTTQECLDRNILKMVKPQDNVDKSPSKYFPKDGNKVYEMRYRLPKIICSHCVLQWRYISGNNWGDCKNGTEAIGCGAQEEFRACADISISGKGPSYVPTSELPELPTTTIATSTTPDSLPQPEETYSPVTAIIISIFSLLAITLLLFLLYFHYYQVGRQVKGWVKRKPVENVSSQRKETKVIINHNNFSHMVPVAPPRMKRSSKSAEIEDNMHEIDLKGDYMA